MKHSMATASPFDSVVRVDTGQLVSSSSMVSRAYLVDSWRAIIVVDDEGDLWLASTLDALGPDREALLARGQEARGPAPEYATVTLVKISVFWGGVAGRKAPRGESHIANPTVVKHPEGASIGVVPLAKARGFNPLDVDGPSPYPIMEAFPAAGDRGVDVLTFFQSDDDLYWPITRRARVASDSTTGFLNQPGAFALDLRIDSQDSGSPAFSRNESRTVLCGLVRPVAPNVSMLLPARLIAETIVHARQENRSG